MIQLTEMEEKLIDKLRDIYDSPNEVVGVLECLKTDEERQIILDIIEAGGEEASPRNIMYAAINMEDEREAGNQDAADADDPYDDEPFDDEI